MFLLRPVQEGYTVAERWSAAFRPLQLTKTKRARLFQRPRQVDTEARAPSPYCTSLNRGRPHPAQWLPKPATIHFPRERRSLREMWSQARHELGAS